MHPNTETELEAAAQTLLERCSSVDAPWVADVIRCAPDEATIILNRLVSEGIAERTGARYHRNLEYFAARAAFDRLQDPPQPALRQTVFDRSRFAQDNRPPYSGSERL